MENPNSQVSVDVDNEHSSQNANKGARAALKLKTATTAHRCIWQSYLKLALAMSRLAGSSP